MQRQLGHIDIVAWQDRRIREQARLSTAAVTLGAVAGMGALILLLHFAFGLDLPLPLLQAAFAVLVVCGALLLMRVAVGLALRLQRR